MKNNNLSYKKKYFNQKIFGLKIPNLITQIYSYNFTTNKKKIVKSGFNNYAKTIAQPCIYWYAINNKVLLNQSLKIDIT